MLLITDPTEKRVMCPEEPMGRERALQDKCAEPVIGGKERDKEINLQTHI
jgi:hypothetical protein